MHLSFGCLLESACSMVLFPPPCIPSLLHTADKEYSSRMSWALGEDPGVVIFHLYDSDENLNPLCFHKYMGDALSV